MQEKYDLLKLKLGPVLSITSHDITEKIEFHWYTEEVVDKRSLNGIHTLIPLIAEPVMTAVYTLLHHICYKQHHLTNTGIK